MAREVNAHHESMRESEHSQSAPSFKYEIVALKEDGSEAFRTESCKDWRKAIRTSAELNALDVDEMPDSVVAYEPIQLEE
jgi:hypothetical protein